MIEGTLTKEEFEKKI